MDSSLASFQPLAVHSHAFGTTLNPPLCFPQTGKTHFSITLRVFKCPHRRDARGYDLQSTSCGAIASGNSIVFAASYTRNLVTID